MAEELRKTSADVWTLPLLLLVLVLGVLPQAVHLTAGFQPVGFAAAVLALNLVVCGFGIRAGRLRFFWIAYAAASVIAFVLLGLTSPVAVLLMLAAPAM